MLVYALYSDSQKELRGIINNELYNINSVLFCESNPIPIKAAMYIAGIIDTLEYRLPLTPPSSANMKLLEEVMKNYNIVK